MSQHPLQLRAAYADCRHIARSAAKNYYYGFLVLPARTRSALCAVYAFMRHADDISDDPSLPVEERRQELAEWMLADDIPARLSLQMHKFIWDPALKGV